MLMTPPPQGNVFPQNRNSYSPTQATPGLQQQFSGTNRMVPNQLGGAPTLGPNQSAAAMNMNAQIQQLSKALGFRS